MSNAASKLLASSGASSSAVYVDDVFSIDIWDGNNSTNQITNGVDLSGEGGMVWVKLRDGFTSYHVMMDTERGANDGIYPNRTQAEASQGAEFSSFNSDGFTLGGEVNGYMNSTHNSANYCGWTFRKQAGFFDVVTYTGDGTSNRQIAHNLGCEVGMMFFKKTNGTGDWKVFHRELSSSGLNGRLRLDSDGAEVSLSNNFFVSSTHFGSNYYNASGDEWVVYLFAHNAQEFGEDSDEAIIKCGTINANSPAFVEDIGFEPQWMLIKKANSTGSWHIIDTLRGSKIDKNGDHASRSLYADSDAQESGESYSFGIANKGIGAEIADGNTYIYCAIRRSHKPASEFTADKMFKAQSLSAGEGADTFISTGFPVDMVWTRKRTGAGPLGIGSRVQGGQKSGGDLLAHDQGAEGTNSGMFFLDHSDGATVDFTGGHFNIAPAATDTDYIRYFFRRAAGFLDVVAYTTTPSSYSGTDVVKHSLGVAPDLIIVKNRSGTGNIWMVYNSVSGANKYMQIESSSGVSGTATWSFSSAPTATTFTTGFAYPTGTHAIAYLFASADGISKVGGYTGNGSSQTINCGFSAGASFVLIKRTDGSGNWYYADSARGIVAGNDPFNYMNEQYGENNSWDSIDPDNSGFIVNEDTENNLNVNGASYIFLAIA